MCDIPGCRNVLVIDGNMKNARQVCSCKNIAQLNFDGMDGSVVVGKLLGISPDITWKKVMRNSLLSLLPWREIMARRSSVKGSWLYGIL